MKHTILILICSAVGLNAHGFWYKTSECVSSIQTNFTITNLGGGLYRWSSALAVTNNSDQSFTSLGLAVTKTCQGPNAGSGCGVDSARMQWDNNNTKWNPRLGGTATATAENSTGILDLVPENTNVDVQPDFNVNTGSEIPIFVLGAIGPGETKNLFVNHVLTTGSSEFYYGGAWVVDDQSCSGLVDVEVPLFGGFVGNLYSGMLFAILILIGYLNLPIRRNNT